MPWYPSDICTLIKQPCKSEMHRKIDKGNLKRCVPDENQCKTDMGFVTHDLDMQSTCLVDLQNHDMMPGIFFFF